MEGIEVNFAAVTGHFHVGSNMPGYLPEADVFCAENLEQAGQYLAEELERAQSLMADMCEAGTPEQQEKGSDCCGWCAEYWSIETARVGIVAVEHDVLHRFVQNDGYTYHHTPPSGAPIVYWISNVAGGVGPIDKCDIFKDQCDINPYEDDTTYSDVAVGEDGCEVEIIDADAGDGTEVEII